MPEQTRRARSKLAGMCAVWLACVTAQPAAAEDASAARPSAGLAPDYVWFTASATLLSASLGGLFALRVHTLYDQANALPGVSPERLVIRQQTEHAEFAADCLFATAAVFAATTVFLAFMTDWGGHAARQPEHAHLQLIPVPAQHGAGLVLQGALP
jgi:hypothetical protein